MNLIARTLNTLAFLALPAAAWAQESAPVPSRWAAGLGVAVIDSPYAGEGSRERLFPLVNLEGERFFLHGISGGVHLHDSDRFTFDAILAVRFNGFDISDLGRVELQANGLDPALLDDRDDGLDAGVRATYRAPFGTIELEGLHDVSGASQGYEISLDYRYAWTFDSATLTASAGASWMSSDLTGYYFGILDEEVARGVQMYTPGSALVPRVGVSFTRRIGSTAWQFLSSVDYQFLPSELSNSPLLGPDNDHMGRVVIGISRGF